MKAFKIGLVLSGGATAGAYSAGVIDFLLEALSEWEKVKSKDEANTPSWTVQVDNMTASSAGALVTMLTAVSLGTGHEAIPTNFRYGDKPPKNNILYRSWVSEFGRHMFDNSDLPPNDSVSDEAVPVRSLVNSRFLRGMAESICLNMTPDRPIPDWARDMRIFLTVTNMRGIPYSSDMCVTLNEEDRKYRMLRHSDCIGFATGKASQNRTMFKLNLESKRHCADWQRLYDVAAASASVPVLFPSMMLSRPLFHYGNESLTTPEMQPDWLHEKNGVFLHNFNASDGGLLNNEPIGLCRNAMESSSEKSMEKSPEHAWGACILIDCNSNAAVGVETSKRQTPYSLVESAINTIYAVMNEAAFKDSDFFKAMDNDNCSQYLISPMREERQNGESILACSTMSLFGGLLHERIRHHDFMLGRRNCQKFLQEHFTVEVERACTNEIFPDIVAWAGQNKGRTPIIPLVGTAAKECSIPDWPKFSDDEKKKISKQFQSKVHSRLVTVITTYARNMRLLKPATFWNVLKKGQAAFIRFVIRTIARFAYKGVDRLVQTTLKNF